MPLPGRARDEPSPAAWVIVLATVALSLLWIAGPVLQGGVDALLATGEDNPARPPVEREIPDLAPQEGIGHDGGAFYTIARHPFGPERDVEAFDSVPYRYRRILFPLLAGGIAPGGGRPLIAAFAVVSLAGVALGAAAIRALGRAPWWTPLTVAISPAVVASLSLTLADALGSGLALAAVAAATRRRWALATLAVVLAVLTRETYLVVALGLVVTPAMPTRWRVGIVTVPVAVLAGWMSWLAAQVGQSALGNNAGQVALPMTGWFGADPMLPTVLTCGAATALFLGAAWRVRRASPHVAVVLALQAGLCLCLSSSVAFHWVNSLRTAVPLLPLAVWALVCDLDPATTPEVEDDERTSPAVLAGT